MQIIICKSSHFFYNLCGIFLSLVWCIYIMARISDEILQNVDIVDVIGKYVQLKRAGSNFSGNCPFHNEKTPSFIVSPQKQIFKCFGCGIGGNVITFIKEIERVDFWDAAKILAKEWNIDLSHYEKNYHKYEEMNQWKEKIKRLHKLTQDFFQSSLTTNPVAMNYLKEQRKLSEDTIKTFGIGYAPHSHYELLQKLKSKWFNDGDLQEASLAKQWQNWESYSFFRNRITFPIYDKMWNVIAFSARIIDPQDKPKYLNSAEHPAFEKSKILYGLNIVKQHIKEFGFIIVVEWQMDVISLYQLGYPIAVATSGTALTHDHIKLIKRYTDKVYFLFDNDSAGQKATIRALKTAYQQDVFPKLIQLPDEYKDADELAQIPWGKEKFQWYIDQAIDTFLSIYKRLETQMDLHSPIDKQKLLNTMFDIIVGLPNPSTQIHYLSVLSELTGQNNEIINTQYKQYAKNEWKFTIQQQNKREQWTKQKIYQDKREDIFSSLFYQDFLLDLIQANTSEDQDFAINSAQKILALGKHIAKLLPASHLGKLIHQTDSLPEEKLWSAQLRREKEMQSMSAHEDKLKRIKKTISPVLKQLLEQIRKLPHLDITEKQGLFEEMKSIKR